MVEEINREKRKILVTGASGMLAFDLCLELSSDYDVIGFDILDPKDHVRCALSGFIKCDMTDREATVSAIKDACPDIILHAACWTDVDGCEKDKDKAAKINIDGTKHIAAAARELNIPILFISTDFVFNGRKNGPYLPDDRPDPISFYGYTKFEGEKEVAALNNYIIVRTSWLYGVNGRNFVDAILGKARTEKALKVVNDQAGSPTYTKDLSKAIKALLGYINFPRFENRKSKIENSDRIYHISNKGTVSWFEYAKEILKLAGINDVTVQPITSEELNRPAKRPGFSGLDTSGFEKCTGHKLREWTDALKEYLNEKR